MFYFAKNYVVTSVSGGGRRVGGCTVLFCLTVGIREWARAEKKEETIKRR